MNYSTFVNIPGDFIKSIQLFVIYGSILLHFAQICRKKESYYLVIKTNPVMF
jgi:hypothetical protein